MPERFTAVRCARSMTETPGLAADAAAAKAGPWKTRRASAAGVLHRSRPGRAEAGGLPQGNGREIADVQYERIAPLPVQRGNVSVSTRKGAQRHPRPRRAARQMAALPTRDSIRVITAAACRDALPRDFSTAQRPSRPQVPWPVALALPPGAPGTPIRLVLRPSHRRARAGLGPKPVPGRTQKGEK